MKKLLFLFTILLLISCSNTIEADAKKFCDLSNQIDLIQNENWDELQISYEGSIRNDTERVLFQSYRGGIFEFSDSETNEPILVNTDSLSNFAFIEHPSFITTVANQFKADDTIFENLDDLRIAELEELIVLNKMFDHYSAEREKMITQYSEMGKLNEFYLYVGDCINY